MKVQLIVVATDNGDGSASCLFFRDEKEAEAYLEAHEACFGECTNPENISHKTLEFDDNGVLLNPDKWED